jgi:hypothetical protein
MALVIIGAMRFIGLALGFRFSRSHSVDHSALILNEAPLGAALRTGAESGR